MARVVTGVIPAAGMGTRMGYLSRLLPKTLFPLGDKPIIHHILDNMAQAGIKEFIVIVNYKKERIIEYLSETQYKNQTIFLEQTKLTGIADSIMLSEKHIQGNDFMVVLGDDCTIGENFDNVINYHISKESLATEAVVDEHSENVLCNTNCIIMNSDGQIERIVEKPKTKLSDVRGCGVYVFSDPIFDYIRKTEVSKNTSRLEISDAIDNIARNGKAYGYHLKGYNFNINSTYDLLQAWNKVISRPNE